MHPRTAPQPGDDSSAAALEPVAEPRPLTRRQRTICRAYFANGCKTARTARALGLRSTRYIREVKARPAAVEYLDALEERTVELLATAQAARILAPMLT